MSSLVVTSKDKRVLDIDHLFSSPGFKYLDYFYTEKLKREEEKILRVIRQPLTEALRESLNILILRTQILRELKNSFKESLEEYTKSSDLDFTDLSGA